MSSSVKRNLSSRFSLVTMLFVRGQGLHVNLQQWVRVPTHLRSVDIFLDYFTFERLVSPVYVGLVLFHFKGKAGHKLPRNFMALSKAQIGSQGKIKLQLLYGKSNGKERLLPEKRGHCLREWRDIL